MLKLLIYALPVILTIYGLIDCVLTPESDMRWLPKVAWIVAILLSFGVGAAIWLIWGREDSTAPRARGISRAGRSSGPLRSHRTTAPDDDPEFLRQLRNSDREHEQVLRQWERELRRREGGSPGAQEKDPPTPKAPSPPAVPGPAVPGPAATGPAATGPESAPEASPETGSGPQHMPSAPDGPDIERPGDDDH